MGIPSNPIKPGTTVQGKISWFGGPHDPSAGGAPASGLPITVPGIALYNRATLGGYWRVTAPNGRTQVVRQTDLGPAPFTGRTIDFTYSSLPGFGYSEGNFPTDGVAKAVYLGRSPNDAVAASPAPRGGRQTGMPGPQSISVPGTAFDQAGFQQAQNRYLVGNLIRGNGKSPYDFGPQANVGGGSNALFASGLLPTTAPNPGDFTKTVNQTLQLAQSSLQHLAGGTVLHAHPGVQAGTLPVGKAGGGFLPAGAKYIVGRRDQGRDGTTNAGGAIVAPGAGYVVRVGSDPGGFGPAYPIVHFTSGPYAGRTMYLGHTLASVSAGQKFGPGQVLSHTGTHGVGNATVPGWFEIGFADGGSPGPMGQAVPF